MFRFFFPPSSIKVSPKTLKTWTFYPRKHSYTHTHTRSHAWLQRTSLNLWKIHFKTSSNKSISSCFNYHQKHVWSYAFLLVARARHGNNFTSFLLSSPPLFSSFAPPSSGYKLCYKCHPVHVCCRSVHIWAYWNMRAICQLPSLWLTVLCVFSSTFFCWTLNIWRVLLNQNLTQRKKKKKNKPSPYHLQSSLQGNVTYILYIYTHDTVHSEYINLKVLYTVVLPSSMFVSHSNGNYTERFETRDRSLLCVCPLFFKF